MSVERPSYVKIRNVLAVVFVLAVAVSLFGLGLTFLGVVPFTRGILLPSTPQVTATVPTLTPTTGVTLVPEVGLTATATATHTPTPTLEAVATRVVTTTTGYTVRPGDTLYSIARRYGISVSELAGSNAIENPSRIGAGQRLLIPQTAVVVCSTQQPCTATPTSTPTPSPTATSTPWPTVTPTATPTETRATAQVGDGGLLRGIAKLAEDPFRAWAGTCISGFAAIVTFLAFVSTTALSWQKPSRELTQTELEKAKLEVEMMRADYADRALEREAKQVELDRARLEIARIERELEQSRRDRREAP